MQKLMDIYYKIWVDCILRIRSQKKNKDTWAEWSMISMSSAMICNFLFFIAILERNILGFVFYKIDLSIPDEENYLLNILILFILPIFIVNYLLIFLNKRCIKLVKKYKYTYTHYNGKLAFTYIVVSMLLPIVLLFIGIIIYQDVTFWDIFGGLKEIFKPYDPYK